MIYQQLKVKSLELRKERNPLAPAIQFALSEIEKVGKNNGNRETTDDEAIKVIQKIITNIDANIQYLSDTSIDMVRLKEEKQLLSTFLPKMATEDEILTIINPMKLVGKNKGEIMKAVKAVFGAKVDMKQVGVLIDEN